MRFLISMVFVGMLALSSQAFAAKIEGAAAEKIIIKGEVVAERWKEMIHHTRVIYKNRYYKCLSFELLDVMRFNCFNSDRPK